MLDTSPPVEAPHSLPAAGRDKHVLTAAKGGGITFAGKIFTSGSRFIMAILLTRLLGAEQYGLFNLGLSAITVTAGLSMLGLDTAIVRYVSLMASRRDEAGVRGAIQFGLGTIISVGVLLAIGLYLLAEPIANHIFHEPQLAPLVRLASVFVPILALSDGLVGSTEGFKKMQYGTISQDVVRPLLRIVLIGVLLIIGLTAAGAMLIFGLAVAVTTVMLVYYLNKEVPLKSLFKPARPDIKEMLSFSMPVYLSGLLQTFRSNFQIMLLGSLSNVTSVGIFAVASQVGMVGGLFQGSVIAATKPILAELYDQNDREQMGRLYQTATKWMFTLNFPIFLVMVLFPEPLMSIFGKSFVGGAAALTFLAWAKLIDISTGMCGAVLDMSGYAKLKLIHSIIQLVISLALNFLLIPQWGILGAAAAALVIVAIINTLRLVQVYTLLRLLPYNLSFLKPVAAGLMALLITLLIEWWFPTGTNFIYIAVHTAVLVAIYAGLVLLLGLSTEDRLIIARLRRRAGNKWSKKHSSKQN
jgi:O-antigen/teichoic acid export membrane protein